MVFDCARPAVLGVDELGAGGILEVADAFFGNAILPVCIDATVSDILLVGSAIVDEGIVGEASIVGMVVLYVDTEGAGVCFEGVFGVDGFFGGDLFHKVYEGEATEVVDEDGGIAVALCGGATFQLSDETWGG